MHWKHETEGTFQNFEQLSELSPICIIENDKCSGQYKSTNTLRKWMQCAVTWTIAKNWKIVAMFSTVGHDKGEWTMSIVLQNLLWEDLSELEVLLVLQVIMFLSCRTYLMTKQTKICSKRNRERKAWGSTIWGMLEKIPYHWGVW